MVQNLNTQIGTYFEWKTIAPGCKYWGKTLTSKRPPENKRAWGGARVRTNMPPKSPLQKLLRGERYIPRMELDCEGCGCLSKSSIV